MKFKVIHDTFVDGEHVKKNEVLDLDPDDASDKETIGHLNAARRIVEVGSESEKIWDAEEAVRQGKGKTKAQAKREEEEAAAAAKK